MDGGEVPDRYFTYDGRLASFHSVQPTSRRKSNAKGRAPKANAWPHKQLDPANFAKAGFYFDPDSECTDNAVCFLCHKRLGGWDDDDNPVEEHLRHSPYCGWAIVAAIEAGVGDYNMDDPSHPDMMEARKATFAGRWPHEGKKGWRCKVKQMVDAGWKYTPTIDSDDMATCTYCQLALDGWEPKDQPMNEHYKRSPECPFFTLINQYQSGPAKKTARGKGTRTSKVSRLSAQSVNTIASDVTSLHDLSADPEDSVMTTTSVMTAGGTKRPRAKKAATARGKKTKGKTCGPLEVLRDPPEEEELPPPPPRKPTRGRKRASDAVEDSVLTNAEAPAPKKRVGRTRRSNTVDNSIDESQPDVAVADSDPAPPTKTTRKKGKAASKTRSTCKSSMASTASSASLRSADEHVVDDDEIDRQLLADLDRRLSDEEITADSDSERKQTTAAKAMEKKAATKKSSAASSHEDPTNGHAMFDPSPVEIDDADMSAELKELQAKMEAEEAEPLQVPKKGRKAGATKPSMQTKKSKTPVEPEPELQPEPRTVPYTVIHDDDIDELSILSNATVVKSAAAAPAPKKRGRPKKNSAQAQPVLEDQLPQAPSNKRQVENEELVLETDPISPMLDKLLPPAPADEEEPQPPSTPRDVISPAPAAKQPALSPSQSPQSSDAENQPPSSKPSNTANSSRVALALITATPMPSSPSKRNVHFLSGLQSSQAWSAVDLDVLFEHLGKENGVPSGSSLDNGMLLTSPEKKMTVEEWIYHNASLAEASLKGKCEAMISKFESEGGRAMNVLEGVMVE